MQRLYVRTETFRYNDRVAANNGNKLLRTGNTVDGYSANGFKTSFTDGDQNLVVEFLSKVPPGSKERSEAATIVGKDAFLATVRPTEPVSQARLGALTA